MYYCWYFYLTIVLLIDSCHCNDTKDTIKLITDHTINIDLQDQVPQRPIFKPTSILRPGYGVLFDHIGRLFHTVQTHYLSIGIHLPSKDDIPAQPPNDTFYCVRIINEDVNTALNVFRATCDFYNNITHHIANRIAYVRQQLYHKFHTEIPALLPNQEIGFEPRDITTYTFKDLTQGHVNRGKRNVQFSTSVNDTQLSFVDRERVKTYYAHYGKPLHDDTVTLFGRIHHPTTRHKRASLQGIIRGANIFGTIISKAMPTIKKVGGFIFKGLKGLFHRHRHTALLKAASLFRKYGRSVSMKLNALFALKSFKNLHLSKLSFFQQLHLPYIDIQYPQSMQNFLDNVATSTYRHNGGLYPSMNLSISANARVTLLHQRVLNDLLQMQNHVDHFLDGLATLSTGKLPQSLIHPDTLLNLLRQVVKDVTSKNAGFTPLFPELYHYYDTEVVSFTNTNNMIILQIPILFVNQKQAGLDLFRMQTTPVPLDIDTYQRKEHKYTTVEIETEYLAITDMEYAHISDVQLDTCLQLHENHICEGLRLTASRTDTSCMVAIFRDAPLSQVKDACSFTYHNHMIPEPAVLQTQDEILLAHLPPGWMLICDNEINRPIPFEDSIYAIVNRYDLCTCGILAQNYYLYESMRGCKHPDVELTLYYTQNKALVAYDPSLAGAHHQRLHKLPPLTGPQISRLQLKTLFLQKRLGRKEAWMTMLMMTMLTSRMLLSLPFLSQML